MFKEGQPNWMEKRLRRAERGPSGAVIKFAQEYADEFQPEDQILEVGSGEARNFEAFSNLDKDLKLHGIELDPRAVELSRQLLKKQNIDAEIIEGSFTDLSDFDDESMRAVVSHSSVQNAKTFEDAEKAIAEISRVLIPGGLYLLRENRTPRLIDADRTNRVAYFTEEELEKIVDQFGFEILQGDKPIESGDDADRVGGKKIAWNMVLRKKGK